VRAATNILTAGCRTGLAAPVLLALAALVLAGCATVQRRGFDPLAVDGRLAAAPVS